MAMLVCSDIERSRDFYRNVMGLRMCADSPTWVAFEMSGGGLLGLHPAGDVLTVRPGSLQLAFHVRNVDAFVADARLAGARILQEPFDEAYARVAVLADPDGYAVQVGSPRR